MMDNAIITELRETISNLLSASNMLYWMTAARVMYAITARCLERFSPTYRTTQKKLNLTNYWVQLVLYTLVLPVFLWSAVAIHSNDVSTLEVGLKVFANVAMLLLAMYSMELYLRGHLMDVALLVHHVLLIVITLYVIDSEDSTVKDPRDLIDFGIIEGLGALTEQPTLLGMIYYRCFSDSSTEEKAEIRPTVASRLRLSLFTFLLLKCALFVGSFVWYGVRFDYISSSNLVWIVPLLRTIHTPTLVWSFYVQWKLYVRVVTSRPLKDAVEETESVCDSHQDEETRVGDATNSADEKPKADLWV